MAKQQLLTPNIAVTGDTTGYMNVLSTTPGGEVQIVTTGATVNTIAPDRHIVIGDVLVSPGHYKVIPTNYNIAGNLTIQALAPVTIGSETVAYTGYLGVDGYLNCTGTIDNSGTLFVYGPAGTGSTSGTSGGYDADAQAFLTAAAITDVTIGGAINTLVVGLKTNNIWSKLIALYPMVGGLADTHKYNLIDIDTHIIDFYGGWSHSASGATANGTTSYGDTNFNPFTALVDSYSFSLGYYGSVANPGGVDMGVQDSPRVKTGLFGGNILSANIYIFDCWDESLGRVLASSTDASGFWVGSRTTNNNQTIYDSGSSVGTNGNTVTVVPPSFNYFIGASNKATTTEYFSTQNFRLAFFGNGLTSTDVSNFNTLVTTFQTTLSRNIA
jgi:hypothetical protein